MAGKTIQATAVISAKDATGNIFDKIAAKMKGVEKVAKSFAGIKPMGKMGWGDGFSKEVDRMQASARELATIHKSWASFNTALSKNGPMGAAKALGALDMWKRGTLASLREVKGGYNEVESAHKRFFRSAGSFVLGAGMIGSGYGVERAGRAAVKSAAERSREMARYDLSGMTSDEKARANAKADEIAGRNPTIPRTEILGHIRQLKARLGSFDHAMDNVETVTNAQTVLGTLGHGGEEGAADLEKLTTGLESQGVAANPAKFRTFMNAFVKAKSVFPDLTGDKFQQYMQASNASKYGLSEDYLASVAPTMMQHNRAPNFGVEQSSAFSALIGGRQSKTAKAAMRAAGLLDDNGHLIHEKAFVSNPYEWARSDLKSSLSRQGIATDEEHRGDMVTAMTRMFSNRKVADFFTSLLVNEGVIEKDKAQLKLAKGTEGVSTARNEDGFQAAQAINTQLKDAAAAFLNIGPVVKGMNAIADKMSAGTNKFDQGTTADKTGMVLGGTLLGGGAAAVGIKAASAAYQWFTGSGALMGSAAALDASAAALTSAAAALAGGKTLAEVAAKVLPGGAPAAAAAGAGGAGLLSKIWGYGAAALPFVGPVAIGAGAYLASEAANDYSGITRESTRARQRRQQAKYNWWGEYDPGASSTSGPGVSDTMTYGTGVGGDKSINVSGTVTGNGELKITVEAGSSLLQVVEQARASIRLTGQIGGNGAGSAGQSSPDAAAPPPRTGGATGDW